MICFRFASLARMFLPEVGLDRLRATGISLELAFCPQSNRLYALAYSNCLSAWVKARWVKTFLGAFTYLGKSNARFRVHCLLLSDVV